MQQTSSCPKAHHTVSQFSAIPTTHSVSNCRMLVDADTASSDMFAIAVVVPGTSGPGSIQTVGVRYTDELVRTAAGWKIRTRTHSVTWQIDSEAVPIRLDVENRFRALRELLT
ncbi:nuclear transport factor 2 family protein [Gymnodinialimonas sp. 2305UL16-5]|uniref:nuclear transport factor 2 family protein n=1 Tax=Gymnodinialimonas mytili TaxID=3126503 RepID=UPI0030992514